jgi:hypothetical protein
MTPMSEEEWNDSTRDDLRETLRSDILGELRLSRRGREQILEACREHVWDECPESEWDEFLQFAADELQRAAALLAAEKTTWPLETDCDRLDRVEAALRERGILLWQVSPCCDTCTRSELADRIAVIDERYPGFRDRVRGYAFFIDQNMPEMLSEGASLSLYLGYGWISQVAAEVSDDLYQKNALGIAREVCQALRDEGFEPDWDGNLARKIGVSVDWRRRTMLE